MNNFCFLAIYSLQMERFNVFLLLHVAIHCLLYESQDDSSVVRVMENLCRTTENIDVSKMSIIIYMKKLVLEDEPLLMMKPILVLASEISQRN